MYKIAATCRPI